MWKFHWTRADMSDPLGFGKLIIGYQDYREFRVAQPLILETVPQGRGIKTPTLDFSAPGMGNREQFQQALMDNLWAEGVRPSDHKMTSGATEKHLDDMRKIVSKQLGVTL